MKYLALVVLLTATRVLAEDDRHILVIGSKPDHPFATHMYEFDGRLLVTCLNKNRGVSAAYVPTWPPSEEQLANADVVAFYSSPAGSVLLSEKHQRRFARLMARGTGFVAIHWGTGVGYDKVSDSTNNRDLFRSWLGGWFRRPPCNIAIERADLRVVKPEHPIARGWKPWRIHDEFYLDPVLHPQAKSLLEVTIKQKPHVVGWTFERPGGGRSVGITLGHFHHNFAREGFRRMLVNAMLWAARTELPKEGAIVEVTPRDVSLPKQVSLQEAR